MDAAFQPYEGQEPYIFISYARKDKERVVPFMNALHEAGYRVWYDAGIHPGDHWTETLVEKVEQCGVFCPLFSEAFNASRFCFEETEYAYRKDKDMVPVYLEKMEQDDLRPLFRLLGSRQDLRLYQFDTPEAFAARLGHESVFASCKELGWHKIGQIQWKLDEAGVLTIAHNEDSPWDYGNIPAYQQDPINGGSTAPWMTFKKDITSLVISDDITEIGEMAFYDCNRMMNVHIGDNVSIIGKMAFLNCTSLISVHIPEKLKEISNWIFANCKSLTSVHIPNNVTKIGGSAFQFCVSMTNVYIPDSVSSIGYAAFSGCNNLTKIEVPPGTTYTEDGRYRTFPSHTRIIRRKSNQ